MKPYPFIFFTSLLLLSACTHNKTNEQLRLAETIMDETPDSALTLLSEITVKNLMSAQQQAKYALLMSIAQYKSCIEETNDSLIRIAVRYYDSTNDIRRQMLAHYCHAVILHNCKDYRSSVTECRKAEKLANDLSDSLYYAKSNETIADNYHQTYNSEGATRHRRKAIDGYRNAGRSLNALYAQIDLARDYSIARKYEETLALLDSIEVGDAINDSIFMALYINSYILPLLETGRIDDAVDKYHESRKYRSVTARPEQYDFPLISRLFLAADKIDSAEHYLALAIKNSENGANSDIAQYLMYEFDKKKNDYESALSHHEKMMKTYNDRLMNALKHNVAFADRDYYSDRYSEEQRRANNLRTIITCAIMLLVITGLCIWLLHRFKIRQKIRELEEKMYETQTELGYKETELRAMSSVITQKDGIMDRQLDVIKTLFKNNFATLNALSNEYFEKQDSKTARNTIVHDFEREIERIRQPESLEKIQNIVNACLDGIVDKMRRQLPWLKEADVVFLSLIFAGLSPRAVCLLTDNKIGNYYNKRSRLRMRIAESDAADKDLFLQHIKK